MKEEIKMDLVGHCAVAEFSGVLKEEEVYGPGIVELMFPNYMHCHDWAYSSCWEPEQYGALTETVGRLRAHIICDWVIHYGTAQTHFKDKCGWVFQRMGLAEKVMDDFFEGALAGDHFEGAPPDLSAWGQKQRLDFAHSFVEYAADLMMAEHTVTPKRFATIKQGLGRLADGDGYGSFPWALNLFESLGTSSERGRDFIVKSIHQMARDAVESTSPEEFAIRTAAHKYAIRTTPESLRYVRGYLERIAGDLDWTEISALCRQIAGVITDPESIYTGPWQKPA
jgi:hypothetical protein